MPIYDYIYGTVDKASDTLYEKSLKKEEGTPDVVHLTHLTTPESIYHLRLGFSSLASSPQSSEWYLYFMWPFTFWSVLVTWFYGKTFVLERNSFNMLNLQSWVIPRFHVQVRLKDYNIIYLIFLFSRSEINYYEWFFFNNFVVSF
jgi:aldehyde decarbonylase